MGSVSKYGLVFLNVFVLLLGASVVGLSAAILSKDTIFGVLLTEVFYSVPLSALLGGVFLLCLGLLGCVGALRESPCLLRTYATIVGVLLVGVAVVGVTLLVFTASMASFLVDSMTNVYNKYGAEGQEDLSHDLDVLQHTLHCCGIFGYEDWAGFPYGSEGSVPDGCCRNVTEGCGAGVLNNPETVDSVYEVGCLAFVTLALNDVCIALGVLTLALAGFQLLSITWACILARNSVRYQKV